MSDNEKNMQRGRNILTLEERVRAIEAYDINPVYTKVSKLFNCSWEQIKNIIANRETIMLFYEATKRTECNIDANKTEIRQNKLSFLGECMYEYIQRAQFHTKVDVTEELIRIKAFEFLEIMQIENFIPNRTWMNHFKATYGFSLSNRQIKLTRRPPSSLDVKDIMTYCTKHNVKTETVSVVDKVSPSRNLYRYATKIAVSSANEATLQELKQREVKKLQLLETAFTEYVERLQCEHKLAINEGELLKTAGELKEMLQVDKFEPTAQWIKDIVMRSKVAPITRSSNSLNLNDIITDCIPQYHKSEGQTEVNTVTQTTRKRAAKSHAVPTPKARIRVKRPETLNETRTIVKKEILEAEDKDDGNHEDVKPNVHELPSKEAKNDNIKETLMEIQKSETCESEEDCLPTDVEVCIDLMPTNVNNCEDALKLLIPLQKYALQKELYTAVGLLTQLEQIFLNATNNEP